MVRRKPSRAVNMKSKVPLDLKNKENVESKIGEEFIADFDDRVSKMIAEMQSEKESMMSQIDQLYFNDEQRTNSEINNMLWDDYIKRNTVAPHSAVRRSVTAMVNMAESLTAAHSRSAKKRGLTSARTCVTEETPMRTLRRRNESITSSESIPSVRRIGRPRKNKDIQSTPLNQGIPSFSGNVITPKFDFKTPLPLTAARKPRRDEITVSFKGSPVGVGVAKEIDLDEALTELDKAELESLQMKVSKLLNM